MTSRSFVETTPSILEAMAWDRPELAIEFTAERAYLRVGNTTFSAVLEAEVPS
tara:strand:- start:364 stop:522 length:159 start_codon:yes stop_codon:yes gene_type:complete